MNQVVFRRGQALRGGAVPLGAVLNDRMSTSGVPPGVPYDKVDMGTCGEADVESILPLYRTVFVSFQPVQALVVIINKW